MRPCNQCRQPVENSVTICEQCKQWNESHRDQERMVSELKDSPPGEDVPKLHADYSYAILMGAFSLVITALFALIGLAVHGVDGFVIGGSIGIVVGVVLFSIMIKM